MSSFNDDIRKLVANYKLEPHPEGGYFKEVYRSAQTVSAEALGFQFDGERSYCTSIYFLLTAGNFSGFHRIKQDEVWHFYHGHPLTVHVIDEKGKYQAHVVGFDLEEGPSPQLVVPARAWFASSVNSSEGEDGYSFVGCTVAPGFDFRDFEMAKRAELLIVALFPQHKRYYRRVNEGINDFYLDVQT